MDLQSLRQELKNVLKLPVKDISKLSYYAKLKVWIALVKTRHNIVRQYDDNSNPELRLMLNDINTCYSKIGNRFNILLNSYFGDIPIRRPQSMDDYTTFINFLNTEHCFRTAFQQFPVSPVLCKSLIDFIFIYLHCMSPNQDLWNIINAIKEVLHTFYTRGGNTRLTHAIRYVCYFHLYATLSILNIQTPNNILRKNRLDQFFQTNPILCYIGNLTLGNPNFVETFKNYLSFHVQRCWLPFKAKTLPQLSSDIHKAAQKLSSQGKTGSRILSTIALVVLLVIILSVFNEVVQANYPKFQVLMDTIAFGNERAEMGRLQTQRNALEVQRQEYISLWNTKLFTGQLYALWKAYELEASIGGIDNELTTINTTINTDKQLAKYGYRVITNFSSYVYNHTDASLIYNQVVDTLWSCASFTYNHQLLTVSVFTASAYLAGILSGNTREKNTFISQLHGLLKDPEELNEIYAANFSALFTALPASSLPSDSDTSSSISEQSDSGSESD